MPDRLPLLIFPPYRSVSPPQTKGFPPSHQPLPIHARQVERLRPQIQDINSEFQRFKGTIDSTMMGGEPEWVLVLELADKIDNLERAVTAAGWEWLGEWDVDIELDDDFPAQGKKTTRNGRLFVSMVNQQGMSEILSLWKIWKRKQKFPIGKTPWREVFSCLKNIRRWGAQETLVETGMREYFEDLGDEEVANFQIECFYHKDSSKRKNVERDIQNFLNQEGGETIGNFLHMPDIAFHAVKACMPVGKIKALLTKEEAELIHLFIYPSVMYFRRTGQSIVSNEEDEGEKAQYPRHEPERPPVAAILDGVPNLQHEALRNHVNFDDPFDLTDKYQPGERVHGTAMASLLIHGDRAGVTTKMIGTKVHHVAVIEPDIQARSIGKQNEYFPVNCFCEDRIERAVRRIMENEGDVAASAPTVKIINLSLGDPTRPFVHTPSPWARLLDWLSWKYRVLFCVSAGNYVDSYDFGIPSSEYKLKSDEEKTKLLIKAIHENLSARRILAPAESINALTIGALHQDESGNGAHLERKVDILPNNHLASPVSRFGHGFRRSIKPEIYFPGGRQLYDEPISATGSEFKIWHTVSNPGQKVARDSKQEGVVSNEGFGRGTSHATVLATRAGVQIHEMLGQLHDENEDQIPENLMAVLIKTLLVHGSVQNRKSQEALEHLKSTNNSRTFKTVLARYLGYGTVDIERVLGCAEQRGTVVGFGEITTEKIHEYRFPIPDEFGDQKAFRRMVVTLAWFSPVNMRHRYIREAKLEIKPDKKWGDTPLKLDRTDGDPNQVKRGTVQHEVLEGQNALAAFQQAEEIVLQIHCKEDATENLEEHIPYGLAVTLEAAEVSQIPVYERIRERLSVPIAVREA